MEIDAYAFYLFGGVFEFKYFRVPWKLSWVWDSAIQLGVMAPFCAPIFARPDRLVIHPKCLYRKTGRALVVLGC